MFHFEKFKLVQKVNLNFCFSTVVNTDPSHPTIFIQMDKLVKGFRPQHGVDQVATLDPPNPRAGELSFRFVTAIVKRDLRWTWFIHAFAATYGLPKPVPVDTSGYHQSALANLTKNRGPSQTNRQLKLNEPESKLSILHSVPNS